MIPVIDAFKCDGCGVCVQRCPPQIMGLVKKKAVYITDLCEECGICAEACPIDAIWFRLPHLAYRIAHEGYRPLVR